jgi:Sec-independent protein secretion pathway component TatC
MPNEPVPDDILHVWQNQPVENTPMPLEEIRRKARQFEKRISRRNLREYVGAALGIAAFTFYIFKFSSPTIRAGSALIIAGMICIVIQIYKRASPGTLPADAPLTVSIAFHRGELVRQRDLLRSVVWWYIGPIVPGLIVFGAGITPRRGEASLLNAVPLVCMFGLVVWANRRAASRLDRQIAELDNLESQS